MFPKFKSDNLIQLEKLTDKICELDKIQEIKEKKYEEVIRQIEDVVNEESMNVILEKKDKVSCYERMTNKIKIILQNYKFST